MDFSFAGGSDEVHGRKADVAVAPSLATSNTITRGEGGGKEGNYDCADKDATDYEGVDADDIVKLPCRHMYHCVCVFRWLEKNNSCPLCRASFGAEILVENRREISDVTASYYN